MSITKQNKEAAITFLQLVSNGHVTEAYDNFTAAHFRHHNAYFKGDRNSLMEGMKQNAENFPNKTIEIKRILEEGDFVMTHSHVKLIAGELEVAVVHIFRFDNDRIVELWDLGHTLSADSPNEHGPF